MTEQRNMALKIILDANILLNLLLKRQGHSEAKTIYEKIASGEIQCHVTTSIIHICGHWLTKEIGSAPAKKALISILNDMTVIDASHKTIFTALISSMTDVEDALQYYTAMEFNLDCFISNDRNFIKSALPKLPVCSTKDFIKNFL